MVVYYYIFLCYMVTHLYHPDFETNRKYSFLASIPDSKACQSSFFPACLLILTYTCIESQAILEVPEVPNLGVSRFSEKEERSTEVRTLDPWRRSELIIDE